MAVIQEPQDTDWAYAAGFVDGEGCIAIVRSFVRLRARYYYGVQVVVTNRDRNVLDSLQSTWGGWVVAASPGLTRARACWNWRCPTGQSAKPFLTGIRPWLRIKGAQCDNALAMIELLRRAVATPWALTRCPSSGSSSRNISTGSNESSITVAPPSSSRNRCIRPAESTANAQSLRPAGFESAIKSVLSSLSSAYALLKD
jgi:hypothetical protein